MTKKRRILMFNVEVEMVGTQSPEYLLFGVCSFICPEHAKDEIALKQCFLDNLIATIRMYGLENKIKLSPGAQEVKERILDAVTIRDAPQEDWKPWCFVCGTMPGCIGRAHPHCLICPFKAPPSDEGVR